MFEVTIQKEFSAAHQLREYRGDCENLHGHNWKVQVTFACRKLDSQGLAFDFRHAKQLLAKVIHQMDHKYLNELEFFKVNNPSCENISRFIYNWIKDEMNREMIDAQTAIANVRVWESDDSWVTYFGDSAND